MIKIIGLTGQSGSGKTLLCQIAKEFHIDSVDTDDVYHKLLIPPSLCLDEICKEFSKEILNGDGTLNRHSLSKIVFGDDEFAPMRLKKLNSITHKYILSETRKIISLSGAKAILIDAPALFESGFDKECDFIITIIANKKLRFDRVICRDSLSECEATARITSQKDDDFYIEKSDFVIENNGDTELLKENFVKILKEKDLLNA